MGLLKDLRSCIPVIQLYKTKGQKGLGPEGEALEVPVSKRLHWTIAEKITASLLMLVRTEIPSCCLMVDEPHKCYLRARFE